MRISSILIAVISSSFGGYLCYIGQYEAGTAMFGTAVAALALSPNDSDNNEVQELTSRVALLEQQLEHQNEIAQRDIRIALLESRLERLDPTANILPEDRIEVERQLLSEAEAENTLEEEENPDND